MRVDDLDGDGRKELAVMSIGENLVRVLFFDASGQVRDVVEIEPGVGGVPMEVSFVGSLANVTDVDGDGYPELAVGMPGETEVPPTGSVWLLSLGEDASVKAARRVRHGESGLSPPS